MLSFLLVVACVVFLFGLVQWARSGALLWDIRRLLKYGPSGNAGGKEGEKAAQRESLQKSIQNMEMMTDGLLKSSFRVLGALALCVWIFIVASFIAEILGLDWADRMSFSTNRMWGSTVARSAYNNPNIQRSGTFGGNTANSNRTNNNRANNTFRFGR